MSFLRYFLYFILVHFILVGSNLIQIGDAVTVNLDSSVAYKHTSNVVRSSANQLSDDILTITPGAVINFGRIGTPIDLKIKAYYDIIEYQEYSDLDINLFKFYADGYFNPSPLLSSSISYSNYEGRTAISELSIAGADNLVESTTETASFFTNYRYSPKLSFSLGISTNDLTYDTYSSQLASKKSTSIPLKLIYHYSDKLNILYGVSVMETEVGQRIGFSGYDTDSIYYNFGLSGNLLPKLSGKFDVGYRSLSFSTSTTDFNSFGATSALIWKMTPKLKTAINVYRDFDVAGSGSTYRSTRANLSTTYSVSTDYKLSFHYGRTLKYFRANPVRNTISRDEALTSYSLKLNYLPSSNYNFSAGYHYVKSNAVSNYNLKEYRLSATLKY